MKVGQQNANAAVGGGVGKYLNLNANAKRPLEAPQRTTPISAPPQEGKKKRRIGFGDFEGW